MIKQAIKNTYCYKGLWELQILSHHLTANNELITEVPYKFLGHGESCRTIGINKLFAQFSGVNEKGPT